MTDAPEHNTSDQNGPDPDRRRGWGARVWRGLRNGIVGLVLLLGTALLLLQVDSISTWTAQQLATRFNPLSDTELTIEEADGTWLGSLRLIDVTLSRTDSTTGERLQMAHVDTLSAEYRLAPLLVQNQVHVVRAAVRGPSLTMRQTADSTWDWARILPTSEDTTSSTLSVRLDRVDVRRGGWQAAFYTPSGRDSTARVGDLRAAIRNARYDSTFTAAVDTLGLRARVPGDTTDLTLASRAVLTPRSVRLDTLRLASARSNVQGAGLLRLPDAPTDTLDDVQFRLAATPLSFRDVATLVPPLGLDPSETLTLRIRGQGAGPLVAATAEAQFEDGGGLTAKARMTPYTTALSDTSRLRYQLDAQIRDLTTSLLGPRDSVANRLNADVRLDLAGPAIRTLSGPLHVSLRRTTLYGVPIGATTLDATFRDGSARIDAQGDVYDTPFAVNGFARPLDSVPTFNLSGDVRNLNVARLAPDAGVQSHLAGRIQISGSATGEAGPNLGMQIDLEPSTVALGRIDAGTATLRVAPDTLRTDVELTLPDNGNVHVAGHAALDGSERFRLTRGSVRNLDVAAFVGDSTYSAVSGSLAVRGQGLDPASMQLDASVHLRDSRYAHLALHSFEGTFGLADGRLSSTAALVSNGARASMTLDGRPFDARPRFSMTDGTFEHVDVGPLLADTTHHSDLNGTFRASLQGTTPDRMTLDAQVTLDTSHVNREQIDRATLSARLEQGTLDATADVAFPSGRTSLTATATPFADVPTFALTKGRIENLHVGALTGLPTVSTSLNGTLTLQGRRPPGGLILDGELQLDDSRINRAALDGQLSVSTDRSLITAEGRAHVAGGRLRFRGSADSLTSQPAYEATVSAVQLDLDALAGADSSLAASVDSLHWTVSGTGFDPSTMAVQSELYGRELTGADIRVATLDARGQLRDGVLHVDTVDVASNLVLAQGGGSIALSDTTASSRFDLTAEVTGLQPLQPTLGAQTLAVSEGSMDVHLYGSAGRLRYDGEAELHNLVYNQIRLADFSLSFNGAGSVGDPVQQMEAVGTLGFLSLPSLTLEQTDVTAHFDSSLVDLVATTRIDRQHTVRLDARLDPRPDRERLTLRALDMRFGQDQWQLLQEATLSYADAYRVSGLLLATDDQQIAADGVIDFDGDQSFIVTIEQFRLNLIANLWGLTGLGGRMTGTINLSGPATAPRLTSRLDLDIRSEDRDVGTLDLELDYDSLAVDVNAELTHTEGGSLTAEGSVPFDLRLSAPNPVDVETRPVRLTAAASDFSVGWMDPFIDPALMRDIRGTLAGQVEVRGSRTEPQLSGRVSLRGGSAYLPSTEIRYADAQGILTFEGARAQLQDARIGSPNGGRVQATGTITLSELTLGEFDLQLDAQNFLAIDTRAYRDAIVDGGMTLQGTTRRPVLNGTVEVESADVFYNEALAQTEASNLATVQLSSQDQITLEQRFGLRLTEADTTTFDTYQAMAMDLTVEIQRDTWLRSTGTPELNIQFTGDLDLTKAHDQDAQVFGSIEIVSGQSTIRQFGQQFDLTNGTLTFNGDPTQPYLRATAVYEQRVRGTENTGVTITLTLEGRPDDLEPTLSSEPAMDTRNILSYLATGRPANQLLGGGTNGSNLATQVALGQASNFVENLAASELGLDVVRVQIDPRGTSYLTLGRYITPRFFVSIEQPVTSQVSSGTSTSSFVPDLTLEYQLTNFLLLRAQNRQQSLNLNLFMEYGY